MKYLLPLLVTCTLAVGCKCENKPIEGKEDKLTQAEKKIEGLGPIQAPEIEPPTIGQSPDGEMLPGLAFPTGMAAKVDGGSLPLGKEGLVKMAEKAIERGDTVEALAILDVLVLMHSGDPMFLEMRGELLLKGGNKEDGMADLDRCCSLGLSSCCR